MSVCPRPHAIICTLPGTTLVCGDSHTSTHGALGALAFGIGTSEVEHVLASQTVWMKQPIPMVHHVNAQTSYGKRYGSRFETALFNGKCQCMAKDLILQIIGDIGTDGGAYGAMHSGIDAMPVEERITLTNMTTEAGAKNGIIEAFKNRSISCRT